MSERPTRAQVTQYLRLIDGHTMKDGGTFFRSLAESYLALLDEHEWQPIETCPEGVNVALLWISPTGTESDFVTQSGHKSDWWDSGGFENNPTHWLPLPAPPQEG